MPEHKLNPPLRLTDLFHGLATWIAAVVPLLLISAAVVSGTSCSEADFAYLTAALSFLAAMLAALRAVDPMRGRRLLQALLLSLALILALLTAGMIISGRNLSSAGILNVVSFTIVGCFTGALLKPSHSARGKRKEKKHRFHVSAGKK